MTRTLGLVNEDDGMLMGSGWYITKKGMDRIKAGALILAEIERLDRIEQKDN